MDYLEKVDLMYHTFLPNFGNPVLTVNTNKSLDLEKIICQIDDLLAKNL